MMEKNPMPNKLEASNSCSRHDMAQQFVPTNRPASWHRNAANWRLMCGQRELARIHVVSPASALPLGIRCEIFLTDDVGDLHFFDYGNSTAKAKAIAHRAALAMILSTATAKPKLST